LPRCRTLELIKECGRERWMSGEIFKRSTQRKSSRDVDVTA
jgi:hypothetical protein